MRMCNQPEGQVLGNGACTSPERQENARACRRRIPHVPRQSGGWNPRCTRYVAPLRLASVKRDPRSSCRIYCSSASAVELAAAWAAGWAKHPPAEPPAVQLLVVSAMNLAG